jgi:simple sugar transport system ATP-binding protein
MLGESQPILPGGAKWRGREGGTVVVEARGLDVSDDRGVIRVRAASFDIPAGSIVAIAGVEGAGQSALMRTLAARRAPAGGALRLPSSIGFIPADRQRDALILEMTLIENVALRDAARRRGWLRPGDMEARTARLLQDHDVRAPGPRARAATLSGGNQQKLVVARELDPLPELLVAENPARGLDVRAAQEVQSRLRAAASVGAAVVVTSSDLEELVSLADHALVLHAGALVPAPLDVLALGRAMVGA